MPVEYDPKTGLINLHNDQISYVIQILAHRYPVHRYFGRLHYLDDELAYSDSSGNRYTGHQLNTMGIPLKPTNADFTSQLIYLCQN
ncbi:GH36 C-terminal domain-containing protein [Paucilactobacillus nenjiangensis]|uniref:GH36 C-terminal domain-containing protein n=1 Tax=Paucilactobacillus nenjiangensis TaxID=1296540 RepID=UPI001CDC3F8A|nr:GH36 C-terminal domain-containing protein [Paucilactobacillus nenjiangensis]